MSKRSWKTAIFLSIILPISFFTAFRLTGTFHGPATITETMTAETITWNMTRPSMMTRVYENLSNSYADENIETASQFEILDYGENGLDYPSWGNDYLRVRIRVRANVSDGLIHSMKIVFSQTEEDALVKINEDFRTIESDGCKQNSAQILGDHSQAAYFEVYGVDRPKSCRLGILVVWIFLDDNLTDHEITATLETIYFDGTAYKQVNIPVFLEVFAG